MRALPSSPLPPPLEPKMAEDGTHFPVSTTCEEVQCCNHDHPEDDVPCEVDSHCGGGCCTDDKDSDCESNVGRCEDACCGDHEDGDIHEESVDKTEPRGILRIVPVVQGF